MVYCLDVVSDHGIYIQVHPHVSGAAALSEIKERAVKGRSGFAGKDYFVLSLVAVALMANVLNLGPCRGAAILSGCSSSTSGNQPHHIHK